jgi:hypothetical protein
MINKEYKLDFKVDWNKYSKDHNDLSAAKAWLADRINYCHGIVDDGFIYFQGEHREERMFGFMDGIVAEKNNWLYPYVTSCKWWINTEDEQ